MITLRFQVFAKRRCLQRNKNHKYVKGTSEKGSALKPSYILRVLSKDSCHEAEVSATHLDRITRIYKSTKTADYSIFCSVIVVKGEVPPVRL